uniref:Uncharacterized protein n=1 Tax=Homalodisca liturata TaxID=320908 RepID=A0A1B6JW20_9HEMI
MGSGVVLVCVVVSACAALDYSLGPVIPESQYGDEDALQKDSDQDTMEYMDNLKEELDTSITPLSEMNSDVSVDITKRPSKPRARIGRPRKTTLFPVIREVYNGTKRRMKWDNNVNKFIMFNYYYVTRMETDKNQYRRKLREKFLEAYPNFQGVTDQRVADQKRSIKQNRLLDIQTLREIKRAARQQLEKEGIVVENEEDSKDSSFYD